MYIAASYEPKTEDDWLANEFEIDQLFTPSTPIELRDYFSGQPWAQYDTRLDARKCGANILTTTVESIRSRRSFRTWRVRRERLPRPPPQQPLHILRAPGPAARETKQ